MRIEFGAHRIRYVGRASAFLPELFHGDSKPNH